MKKLTKRRGGILRMPCEILAIIHLICTFISINATNIVRNSCGIQAAFYKITSDHAMQIANTVQKKSNGDVTGCVDFCVENYTCKAFNYKKSTKICELLHYDRNEKATSVNPKTGWNYYDTGLYSSQVGQFCRSLTYNPCYPCQCFDSCEGAEMFKCNCTNGVAELPDVYLAFESTPDEDGKIQYDRGHSGVGIAVALISTNAFVEEKPGRRGKVLSLRGVAPVAKIGANFGGTAVKDPAISPLSVSFWLKVNSAYSGQQKMFSTGKSGLTNGILVNLKSSATIILVSIFGKTKMAQAEANIGDVLTTTWCHFAFTSNLAKAPYLVVYLNGRKVATDTSLSSKSYSELNKWPQLVFGTRTIHPANGESWDMQMDDLAIWYQELTEDQISFVYTKGYM